MRRNFEKNSGDLTVAKVGRTVGLGGKLKLHLSTDFPEQFKKGAVFNSGDDKLVIESFDLDSLSVKFKGFDNIDDAAKLTNKTLETTLEDTREHCELGENEFFWFDVVGLDVVEDGEILGKVAEIERYGATDYLNVITDAKLVTEGMPKSFLLPYQDRFVASISIEEGKVFATHAKDILSES
jgi:16S rRNA processing protein RimM